MMTVLEYAQDMNKTVDEVIKKCKEFGISANNEDDLFKFSYKFIQSILKHYDSYHFHKNSNSYFPILCSGAWNPSP